MSEQPNNRRTYGLLGVLGLVAIPVIVIWWPGCRQYPPVTSRESLDLIKLVYAACNTKDPVRLAKAEKEIAKLSQAGNMTESEKAGFEKIVAMAKAGDWQSAEKAALKYAQDQVK